MGCDGGTIPKRSELVKTRKNEYNTLEDNTSKRLANWFYCALSKKKLRQPIVSCKLGKLYNKESIIEHLLNKSKYGDSDLICPHVKSLKDLVNLNLEPNPNYSKDGPLNSRFICPITRKEMNGSIKFVYIKCGCVFSEKGLIETCVNNNKNNRFNCPNCDKEFRGLIDVKQINPSLEDQQTILEGLTKTKNNKIDHIKIKRKHIVNDTENKMNKLQKEIKKSKAIESIYIRQDMSQANSNSDSNTNYLCRGTFNRY